MLVNAFSKKKNCAPLISHRFHYPLKGHIQFRDSRLGLDIEGEPLLNKRLTAFLGNYENKIKSLINKYQKQLLEPNILPHLKCASSMEDLYYYNKNMDVPLVCEWGYIATFWVANWRASFDQPFLRRDQSINWNNSILKSMQHFIFCLDLIDTSKVTGNYELLLYWLTKKIIKEVIVDYMWSKHSDAKRYFELSDPFKGYVIEKQKIYHFWTINTLKDKIQLVIFRREEPIKKLEILMNQINKKHFSEILEYSDKQIACLSDFEKHYEENTNSFLKSQSRDELMPVRKIFKSMFGRR